MRCADYQELISALLDGELAPLSRWRVRRHLRICADCGHWWAEWSATRRALRQVVPGGAPAGFWERVERRLDGPAPRPEPGRKHAPLSRVRGKAALLLTVMLCCAVWAFFLSRATAPVPVQALLVPEGSPEAPRVAEKWVTANPDQAAGHLAGLLGGDIPPIDLGLVGLTLESAARVRLDQSLHAGRLHYTGEKGAADLFVLPGRRWSWDGWKEVSSGRYQFRGRDVAGVRLLSWGRGKETFILVIRRGEAEALRVAVQAARACHLE